MAYQTPITIQAAISRIQNRKFVLPSIQREFVWSPEQIEQLFDSLMRDYPISTFLFWKVEKTRIKDFQFYEFLKDYHEKNAKHNAKADLSEDEDVIAILDGQQRLTSMYIVLKGTYAKKNPYYRWDSPHAFPKKRLYLNLLKPSEEMEMEYDFRFLTEEEAKPKEGFWWFPVSKILELDDISKAMQFLMQNGLTDTSKFSEGETTFAFNLLSKLYNVIHQKGTISYFQEEGEELDKVLQIFIRINSGGTKLSYSDLLLSVATAQWQDKDAREEIHRFVDEINRLGDGFSFSKDFVLKSCLVLGDFSDVKFKVDNFTKKNMLHIEKMWDSISNAIRITINLVARFGFNRDNLTSTNALIPLAYYVLKNKFNDGFITSSNFAEDRKKMKEWLVRVLLKKTFGGTPDNLYPVLRTIINENGNQFPLAQIMERYKGTNKSILFSKDDLDSLLDLEYGSPLTYSALSLLYPGLNQNFRYHQDHIHPQKYFTDFQLNKKGIDQSLLPEFKVKYNRIPNLQLLQATENSEKSAKSLKSWIEQEYSDLHDRQVYMQQHLFPPETSIEFEDFLDFYKKREVLIREKLAVALGVDLKKNSA